MKSKNKRSAPRRSTDLTGPHKYQATHASLEPLFKGEIDYLVRMIRIREVRAVEVMLAPLNLMLSAWYPLAVLRVLDGMSQRELGNRLDLKDAAIGKAIDAMEESGVIQRKGDPNDRRKALIFLTKAGKLLAEEVANKRQQFLRAVVEGFSEKEVEQFSKFLQRSYLNVDKFIGSQNE
jgi:DNA-binding MarR family transcriptional regulator